MNANELADYLDNNVDAMLFTEQPHLDQAATMLRQQQEQINNLQQWEKRQLDVIESQQAEIEALKRQCVQYEELGASWSPAKTLTDEEILEIAKQYFSENLHHGLNFARAILKKAQHDK